MRRRDLITLLGGAAVSWPLAPRAQQPTLPVIGFISAGPRDTYVDLLAAFRQGLKETGYVEGQTVSIEFDGQMGNSTDCQALRPIWFSVGWRSSSRPEAVHHARPWPQVGRFLSSF